MVKHPLFYTLSQCHLISLPWPYLIKSFIIQEKNTFHLLIYFFQICIVVLMKFVKVLYSSSVWFFYSVCSIDSSLSFHFWFTYTIEVKSYVWTHLHWDSTQYLLYFWTFRIFKTCKSFCLDLIQAIIIFLHFLMVWLLRSCSSNDWFWLFWLFWLECIHLFGCTCTEWKTTNTNTNTNTQASINECVHSKQTSHMTLWYSVRIRVIFFDFTSHISIWIEILMSDI